MRTWPLVLLGAALSGCSGSTAELWEIRIVSDLDLQGNLTDDPHGDVRWVYGNTTWRASSIGLASKDKDVALRIHTAGDDVYILATSERDCRFQDPFEANSTARVFGVRLVRAEQADVVLVAPCAGRIAVHG